MNRAVWGLELFAKPGDYQAFERVLAEGCRRVSMRICAYVLMPNHFHLVLWPRGDGDLSTFMAWVTMTHSHRWHAHRGDVGRGRIYQSRFKSFPIQQDAHFLTVCRYVEANPLRAGLAAPAERWPWSSLGCREGALPKSAELLTDWPVERPRNWLAQVNRPQRESELEDVRRCAERGQPFGDERWTARTADRLGLASTLREPGRPKGSRDSKKRPGRRKNSS